MNLLNSAWTGLKCGLAIGIPTIALGLGRMNRAEHESNIAVYFGTAPIPLLGLTMIAVSPLAGIVASAGRRFLMTPATRNFLQTNRHGLLLTGAVLLTSTAAYKYAYGK